MIHKPKYVSREAVCKYVSREAVCIYLWFINLNMYHVKQYVLISTGASKCKKNITIWRCGIF